MGLGSEKRIKSIKHHRRFRPAFNDVGPFDPERRGSIDSGDAVRFGGRALAPAEENEIAENNESNGPRKSFFYDI